MISALQAVLLRGSALASRSLLTKSSNLVNNTGQFLKNVIFYLDIGDLICHSRESGNPVEKV